MAENRKNWSLQEDQIMINLVKKYGCKKWTLISEKMKEKLRDEGRSGKQCRERWYNHLSPKINKEPWTRQEIRKVFELHQEYGNKWTEIARFLKGRTDNSVKNQYYSTIRKALRRICKILGAQSSTSKIKKIKPNELSKLISNFTQFQFDDGENEKQFNQILFDLASEDKYQELKSKSFDDKYRDKVAQIIQKIIDSKPINKKKLKAVIEQTIARSQKAEESSQKSNKQESLQQSSSQKEVIEQPEVINEFAFNIEIQSDGQEYEELNLELQEPKEQIFEESVSEDPWYLTPIALKKQNSIELLKQESSYSTFNKINLPKRYSRCESQFEPQNLQNNFSHKNFFSRSPVYQFRSRLNQQNSKQLPSLATAQKQDIQKQYDQVVKQMRSRIQKKSKMQSFR